MTRTIGGRRRIAAVLLVVTIGLIGAPKAAFADESSSGGGGDNITVVVNQQDGALRSRVGQAVSRDPGPTVANRNVAYAKASCTGCRTVAVAVQVIVLEGESNDVRPANAAVAVNENCSQCQTFAYANQVLLSPKYHVDLSPQTVAQERQIDEEMDQVAASPESFDQMSLDLDRLTTQLVSVIQSDIQQQSGAEASHAEHRDFHEDDD